VEQIAQVRRGSLGVRDREEHEAILSSPFLLGHAADQDRGLGTFARLDLEEPIAAEGQRALEVPREDFLVGEEEIDPLGPGVCACFLCLNKAYSNGMRTTLDILDDLLQQAMSASGARTKRDAVRWALEEALRQKAIDDLLSRKVAIDFAVTPRELEAREIKHQYGKKTRKRSR